jgi:hypothetical protein
MTAVRGEFVKGCAGCPTSSTPQIEIGQSRRMLFLAQNAGFLSYGVVPTALEVRGALVVARLSTQREQAGRLGFS